MNFEKEQILELLEKKGEISITKIHRLLKIPYYRLKYEWLPELEKENKIKKSIKDKFTFFRLKDE